LVSQLSLLYTTFPSKEEAIKVAHTLLEQRLIACANILGSITSLYSWEGEMQESQEVGVFLKTAPKKVYELIEVLQNLHPYDTPAILEIPIGKSSELFSKWAQEEVR